MTFGLRFLIFSAFCLTFGLISAQDDAEIPLLVDGESLTIALDGEILPSLLRYEGYAGEVITLTAKDVSDGDPVDLIMEILRPDGWRLAFNDDHLVDLEDFDLAQTDSALVNLILPVNGEYLIRINSYGGIFVGEAEVTLREVDLFAVEIVSDEPQSTVLTAILPRYETFTYTFEVNADETVVLTARDLSGTLDPLLRLYDTSGDIIAENDDHEDFDLTLNVYDSRIVYTATESGTLMLDLRDFLGRQGQVELSINTVGEDD